MQRPPRSETPTGEPVPAASTMRKKWLHRDGTRYRVQIGSVKLRCRCGAAVDARPKATARRLDLIRGISNAGGRLRTRPGPRCAMRSLMTRHSRPAPVRYPSGRQPADVPRSRRPPRAGTEGVSWPLHRDSGWKRRGSTTRKQIEGARTRRDANRLQPGRIGGSRKQTETACSLMACKRSSVRARLAPLEMACKAAGLRRGARGAGAVTTLVWKR